MFRDVIDEMATLSPSELDDVVASAELDRRQADARLAAAAAVIENRQLYQDHGHRSMKGYLKQQLNCSGARANRIRKMSAVVNQHPDVGEALSDGRVGTEQIDRLASAHAHPRVGERFAEFAPMLLDHAERLEYDDFTKAVKHFENQADEDGAFDDQAFHESERRASVSVTNGAVDVHASGGGPAEAEEMKNIFQQAVEVEFQKDCEARRLAHGDAALEHPLDRTGQQRAFDALHEIFLKSVTAPADGKRPEPLVSFVIDPATGVEALARHGLLDIDDVDDVPVDPAARRCATASGTSVHSDVVVKAMLTTWSSTTGGGSVCSPVTLAKRHNSWSPRAAIAVAMFPPSSAMSIMSTNGQPTVARPIRTMRCRRAACTIDGNIDSGCKADEIGTVEFI